MIIQGRLYGFVEVEIEMPEDLYEYFAEWPPLFTHRDIGREDLDQSQREYAERADLLNTPSGNLVSVMSQKKTVLHTDLLVWYLKKGLVVKNLFSIIQWRPAKPFENWLEKTVEGRREAAYTGDALKDITNKNMANSSYGYALLNWKK